MNKSVYEEIEIDVIFFDKEDIVTASEPKDPNEVETVPVPVP